MNKKFLTTIIFSLFVVFVFATTALAAQHTGAQPKGYELLAPIPGSGIPAVAPLGQGGLAKYLQSLFNLGLGIIIALAVVMIVIGGAQYLSTDAVSGKEGGKDKLWHAVQGLIIALGAFLILNTINPDILKLNLDLGYLKQPKRVEVLLEVSNNIPGCPNCALIPPNNIEVKLGACRVLGPSKACRADEGLVRALLRLKEQSRGINWQVTEAWPPTHPHQSACHGNGRCVDINFSAGFFAGIDQSAKNINTLCEAARNAGLRPFYEVKTAAERDSLLQNGVTCVRAVPQINASHFHIEL